MASVKAHWLYTVYSLRGWTSFSLDWIRNMNPHWGIPEMPKATSLPKVPESCRWANRGSGTTQMDQSLLTKNKCQTVGANWHAFLLSRNVPPEVLACHRDWVVLSGYDWGKCDGDDTILEMRAQPSQGGHLFMVFAFIFDPLPSPAWENKEGGSECAWCGTANHVVIFLANALAVQSSVNIHQPTPSSPPLHNHLPPYPTPSNPFLSSTRPIHLSTSIPLTFKFPHCSCTLLAGSLANGNRDIWQPSCLGNEEKIWQACPALWSALVSCPMKWNRERAQEGPSLLALRTLNADQRLYRPRARHTQFHCCGQNVHFPSLDPRVSTVHISAMKNNRRHKVTRKPWAPATGWRETTNDRAGREKQRLKIDRNFPQKLKPGGLGKVCFLYKLVSVCGSLPYQSKGPWMVFAHVHRCTGCYLFSCLSMNISECLPWPELEDKTRGVNCTCAHSRLDL